METYKYKELLTIEAIDFKSNWLYFSVEMVRNENKVDNQVFRVRYSKQDPISLDIYGLPMGRRFECFKSTWRTTYDQLMIANTQPKETKCIK